MSIVCESGMDNPHESSDPWLDARLRNVPLPLDFLARLEQIADPEIERMERALVDVPLPEGFLDRLRDVSQQPQRRVAWRGLALAASLLISIGAGYWGLTAGGWIRTDGVGGGLQVAERDPAERPETGATSSPDTKSTPETNPNSKLVSSKPTLATNDEPLVGGPVDDANAGRLAPEASPKTGVARSSSGQADANRVVDNRFETDAKASQARLPEVAPVAPAIAEQSSVPLTERVAVTTADEVPAAAARPTPATAKASREMQLTETLGAADRFEELPDLDAVRVRPARGMSPPLVAEYDLRFLLNHHQHPFVVPATNKALQTVEPPLVTAAAGYRQLVRSLAEGRAPAPEDVRTEEFLAALDYGFPAAPAGSVAIEAAASPAPLSDAGWSLLQVAVQAGALRVEDRPPTQLTLVVDASQSMREADRWQALRQAVDRLVDDMGPKDRLSLIAYSAGPELLVENQSREEITRDGSGRLEGLLKGVEARPAANVALAMQMACGLTAHANSQRHTLLISGGRVDSGTQFAARTRERVAELAKAGVKMNVLDFSRRERAAGALDAWAQAAAGKLVRVSDAAALHWHLQAALLGHPAVVAERTSLKISFNPNVVASYRLFGHDRTTLTGPASAETEIDLRSGEAATVLFMLSLKPGGEQRVATIEAAWQEPNYGKRRTAQREVKREQFAASFTAAPASLQMAAVAAFGAETLRGSYFAPASRSLTPVNDLAKQLPKPTLDQPSFAEMTTFLQQAERLRRHGAAALRSATPSPGER
jgi:Ca-activated chloride channel family protein